MVSVVTRKIPEIVLVDKRSVGSKRVIYPEYAS